MTANDTLTERFIFWAKRTPYRFSRLDLFGIRARWEAQENMIRALRRTAEFYENKASEIRREAARERSAFPPRIFVTLTCAFTADDYGTETMIREHLNDDELLRLWDVLRDLTGYVDDAVKEREL